jgi:DNA-binding MarR family transcriptional regulator
MSTDRTENAILLRIDPFIFRLDGLSLFEKMILNYIYSWTIQGRCCFSTSEWLAYKFGFTEGDVNTTLDLLQMKGYIRIKSNPTSRSLSFVFEDLGDPCEGLTSPGEVFTEVD